jgi:hypothetical protein
MRLSDAYRSLLSLYPAEFRRLFSEEMLGVFEQRAGDRFSNRSSSIAFVSREFSSVVKGAYVMWLGKRSRPCGRSLRPVRLSQISSGRSVEVGR